MLRFIYLTTKSLNVEGKDDDYFIYLAWVKINFTGWPASSESCLELFEELFNCNYSFVFFFSVNL